MILKLTLHRELFYYDIIIKAFWHILNEIFAVKSIYIFY